MIIVDLRLNYRTETTRSAVMLLAAQTAAQWEWGVANTLAYISD
jgi:hypothetical protein